MPEIPLYYNFDTVAYGPNISVAPAVVSSSQYNIPSGTLDFNLPKFITDTDLEYYFKKIYNIIKEHTNLDITEEEFMNLLKDDNR